MSAYFSKSSGTYEASNLAPLFIRKSGSGWELVIRHHETRPTVLAGSASFDPVTMRETYVHRAEYVVNRFGTLRDAKFFGLPLIRHPQAVAAAEGFALMAARKLKGFGGHERARRHDERMAAYVLRWGMRTEDDTDAAYVLMPAKDGGDGFAYFEKADTSASIEDTARELGIDAKDGTAWNVLHAATEGDVSNEDMTDVLAWCRDWARDTFPDYAEVEDEGMPASNAHLLRVCDRNIEGGLRFVLEDVRRVREHDAGMVQLADKFKAQDDAGEHADIRMPRESELYELGRSDAAAGLAKDARFVSQSYYVKGYEATAKLVPLYAITEGDEPDTFTVESTEGMSGTEAMRAVEEAHEGTRRAIRCEGKAPLKLGYAASYRWTVWTIREDDPDTYAVERLTRGEDGPLYYVTHCQGGTMVPVSGGYIEREGAERERADLAKLAGMSSEQRKAVETLRDDCPAPGDYGIALLEDGSVTEYRYLKPGTYDRNAPVDDGAAWMLREDALADILGTDWTIIDVNGDEYGTDEDAAEAMPSLADILASTDAIFELRACEYSADREHAHAEETLRLLGMLTAWSERGDAPHAVGELAPRTFSAVGLSFDDIERELTAVFDSVLVLKVAKVEAPAGSIEARASHTLEVEYRHAGLKDVADDAAGWIIEPGHKCRAVYGRDVSGRWSCWMS